MNIKLLFKSAIDRIEIPSYIPVANKRVGTVAFRGFVWEVDIPARNARTASPHHARLSYWEWLKVLVEHVDVVIRCRNADAERSAKGVRLHGVDYGDLIWE